MATKEELDRLAAMGHQLRPDWPLRSLLTYLARNHRSRPYRDLAIALAAVATDTTTQTPKRLEESGPWWKAAQAAFGAPTAEVGPGKRARCEVYGHEHYPATNCPGCRADELIGAQHPPAPAPHGRDLAAGKD